jgi:hypothetical protein
MARRPISLWRQPDCMVIPSTGPRHPSPSIRETRCTLTYVYLDPANPPAEIMLSWCTTAGDWDHRAYWGANQISYGTTGTPGRLAMGALPTSGQWVRLEVLASAVALEGKTLQGMDFALFNGRATWDYTGTASSGSSSGSTNGPVPNVTNAPQGNLVEYDALALPTVGQSMLRVLSPTTLELHLINSEPPSGPVSTWDIPNSCPDASQFTVTAGGMFDTVQSVGFKRRPLYAPLAQRDLSIDNCFYLQLATPVSDNTTVVVTAPGSALLAPGYAATVDPLRYSPAIHINQEGYVSTWPKKAMIGYYLGSLGEMDVPSIAFSIVDANTGATQFQGTLTPRPDVGYSYTPTPYQKVYQADFSSFTTPGQYLLVVPGLGASIPFRVNDGVAMAFARAYELGLYHQRCGTSNAMPFTRFTHGPATPRPRTFRCRRIPTRLPGTRSPVMRCRPFRIIRFKQHPS